MRQYEYRAIACEPDTGDIYNTTQPARSSAAARELADLARLTVSDPELPRLELKIQRRRKAGSWHIEPERTWVCGDCWTEYPVSVPNCLHPLDDYLEYHGGSVEGAIDIVLQRANAQFDAVERRLERGKWWSMREFPLAA